MLLAVPTSELLAIVLFLVILVVIAVIAVVVFQLLNGGSSLPEMISTLRDPRQPKNKHVTRSDDDQTEETHDSNTDST